MALPHPNFLTISKIKLLALLAAIVLTITTSSFSTKAKSTSWVCYGFISVTTPNPGICKIIAADLGCGVCDLEPLHRCKVCFDTNNAISNTQLSGCEHEIVISCEYLEFQDEERRFYME